MDAAKVRVEGSKTQFMKKPRAEREAAIATLELNIHSLTMVFSTFIRVVNGWRLAFHAESKVSWLVIKSKNKL